MKTQPIRPIMQKLYVAIFLSAVAIISIQFASAESEIPNWIKSKIKLWALDKISDDDFLNSLIDLKGRGLLKIGKITAVSDVYSLPSYGKTAFVIVAGRTADYRQTSPVSLIITDPDGVRNEYTVPVLQSGSYSTSIPLSFSSSTGIYKVTAYHNGKELPESFFYVKRDIAIPSWIKNSAMWLANNEISERDFLSGTQYLIDRGIISFDYTDVRKIPAGLDVDVDGLKSVRRGTTQDIDVHVSNLAGAVEGATVFVRVENYGEDILEEFEGITDSNGNYNVSWEISKDLDDIETFLVFVDVTDGIASETEMFSFQVYCLCGEPNCKCRN
jgi:hypothetical protein